MATTNISISFREGEETDLWLKAKKLMPEDAQDKEVVLEGLKCLVEKKGDTD